MDRQRFDHLLEAYGADFARWPADEREAAAAFAVAHAPALADALNDARALDCVLDSRRVAGDAPELLSARILAAHKRQRSGSFDWRAAAALAACAVFGVAVGYGGGLLAPVADDGDYFASAFEAPFAEFDGDEG